jgi:hypothetical protein
MARTGIGIKAVGVSSLKTNRTFNFIFEIHCFFMTYIKMARLGIAKSKPIVGNKVLGKF